MGTFSAGPNSSFSKTPPFFLLRSGGVMVYNDLIPQNAAIPQQEGSMEEESKMEISEAVPETENAPAKRGRSKKPDQKTDALDFVQCIVTALLACILIFVFVGRTVGVIGSSMVPTLHEGDRLIVSNLFYTPKNGDIVILRKETLTEEPIVKRVIATEGQVVDIDFDEGIVYVDGEPLDEDYVNSPTYRQLDFYGPITVPEGCVFVLGDNRNASNDSRDADLGCVDTRYIIGKALLRVLPLSQFGSLY